MAGLPVLSAFEHERIRVSDQPTVGALSSAEVARLERIAERRPGFFTRQHHSVKLAQHVGLVDVGGRVLEVLPKTGKEQSADDCRGTLLNLLHHAAVLPTALDQGVGQSHERRHLLDVFISAFLDAVATIARAGLLRDYVSHEDDLPMVRGRISLGRQATALGMRPDRIACRFDELTVDNQWNRVLKGAMEAVRPHIRSQELMRRWTELAGIFDEVARVEVCSADCDSLPASRRTARYGVAMQWASWILSLCSPSLHAGEREAPSLLFDMNALFETAVAKHWARRSRGSAGLRVHLQHSGHKLAVLRGSAVRSVGLRPDLVVMQANDARLIGDVKWKRLEVDRSGFLEPKREDVFQIFAYAAAYQCCSLALIYPWHRGLEESRETVMELPSLPTGRPLLHIICVDPVSRRLDTLRGTGVVGEVLGFAA